MFRHLDDPAPFRADDQFRQSVTRRGRQLRRRRRLAASFGGLAVTVAVLGGASALYVERRDAAIDRTDVVTSPSVDGATNILLVGSDRRSDPDAAGAEGARADTMMMLRLQPDGSVLVLAIPRDLQDPTTGQKMNAYGGDPQALVDAVGRFLGLPVDHYVELDFEGFVALVDGLGGLDVAVDVPLRDDSSGLNLGVTSCTTLDGETALALVRARHVEGDRTGDFGRMARGQGVLAAALAQLAESADDPVALDQFSRVLADYAVVDEGLSLTRMVEIGRTVAAAGVDGVDVASLPLVSGPDQASLYAGDGAGAILERFGAPAGWQTAPAPAPATPIATVPASAVHPC